MSKTKIFISEVLPCAGDLEVAIVLINDSNGEKEVQLCIPKSCNISKHIGEEVYFELTNGKVRLKAIQPEEPVFRISMQEYEAGEE